MSDESDSHWKLMFPSEYLAAADFRGKDVTLTIKSVTVEDLPLAGTSDKERRPVVRFHESPKRFVMNKTNAKSIAKLHGNITSRWTGKRVSLYPTMTKFGRESVECIRVREQLPPAKGAS